MFRFSDFTTNQLPDFWRTYYKHTDLLKLMAHINSVLGSKAASYNLMQAYDIMNIGEHTPGTAIVWEPLLAMSYRYTAGVAYPHSYCIQPNILSIDTMHERYTDPQVTLQTGIDFSLDEDYLGILRFSRDIPTFPITVTKGLLQGKTIYLESDYKQITPTFVDMELGKEYPYVYMVSTDAGLWDDISEFQITNRSGEVTTMAENVDYVFDPSTNIMRTLVKLPVTQLYIAKGTIRSTRLDDDFGNLFGYRRYDSTYYRDTTAALMPLFFDAPNIRNIVAAANLSFKLPVAKYGNEAVAGIRAASGQVLTDKYTYKMYGANMPLQVGDSLGVNTPLSDALTFYTERTNPGWWKDRLPELFQKYAEDILTPSRKDRMMNTFLKHYLAHVRVDLDKVDTYTFDWVNDVWNLMFDGLPVRSDIIVSTYKHLYDLDMKMPDYEKMTLRARFYSVWCDSEASINGDLYIPTRTVLKPHILNPSESQQDWTIGGARYKILGPNEQFKQFWSEPAMQTPYVEPNFDVCWYRELSAPTLPLVQGRQVDTLTAAPTSAYTTLDVKNSNGMKGDKGEFANFSDIEESTGHFNDVSTGNLTIAGDTVYDYSAFINWDYHGLLLGIDGIVCPFGGSNDYVISEAFFVGIIPKDITFSYDGDVPDGTSISMAYYVGDGDPKTASYTPVAFNTTVKGIRGTVHVKISMTANTYNFPNLRNLCYTTRVESIGDYQSQWANSKI